MHEQPTPQRTKILIIDDDFINREVMKNIFSVGYNFIEADNGEEGLALAMQYQNSLCAILLDVNMPKKNGIEVLQELNAYNLLLGVPVFLITSNDEDELARQAYELGVVDVITKPVTPYIILRRVQSMIELYRVREILKEKVRGQQLKLKENADTIDELHRSTIEALASAIEFRDVESGEHTTRIYDITRQLLTQTELGEGYTEEEIENMAIGSIMHDVGKIAISDVILNKPGKLTREEFEIMKTHTVKGGMLMEKLTQMQSHPSYQYACDIARHHHERYDGRGYPDGLKGEEITVWSQAVSIADVYDALMSPRVYKKAYSADEAVRMITQGECGIFSPRLIKCFLQVEPQLRRWYDGNMTQENAPVPADRDTVLPNPDDLMSRDVSDVLLLMSAVRSAYELMIFVNLSKNTYRMADYDRFLNHTAGNDGCFDDLIASGASTVPAPYQQQFLDTFSRRSLLKRYAEGKRSVTLLHKQRSDDGSEHWSETTVLLMQDPRTEDILNITLSHCVDARMEALSAETLLQQIASLTKEAQTHTDEKKTVQACLRQIEQALAKLEQLKKTEEQER